MEYHLKFSEKKILLIGVGNIGYRHLQSLANLKFDEIDCLEKNKKNKKFKKIFKKIIILIS